MGNSTTVRTLLIISLVGAGITISLTVILIYFICVQKKRTVYNISKAHSRGSRTRPLSEVARARGSSGSYGHSHVLESSNSSNQNYTLESGKSSDVIPAPGPSEFSSFGRSRDSSVSSDSAEPPLKLFEVADAKAFPGSSQGAFVQSSTESAGSTFVRGPSESSGSSLVPAPLRSSENALVRGNSESSGSGLVRGPLESSENVLVPGHSKSSGSALVPGPLGSSEIALGSGVPESSRQSPFVRGFSEPILVRGTSDSSASGRVRGALDSLDNANTPGSTKAGIVRLPVKTNARAHAAPVPSTNVSANVIKSHERKVTFRNKDSFRIIENDVTSGIIEQEVDKKSTYGFAKELHESKKRKQ